VSGWYRSLSATSPPRRRHADGRDAGFPEHGPVVRTEDEGHVLVRFDEQSPRLADRPFLTVHQADDERPKRSGRRQLPELPQLAGLGPPVPVSWALRSHPCFIGQAARMSTPGTGPARSPKGCLRLCAGQSPRPETRGPKEERNPKSELRRSNPWPLFRPGQRPGSKRCSQRRPDGPRTSTRSPDWRR